MAQDQLIQALNRQLDTRFQEDITTVELHEEMVAFINNLIIHDFEKLVALLYKIDIDEDRLKSILKASAGQDSAVIIAELIVEREKQKVETRNSFKN